MRERKKLAAKILVIILEVQVIVVRRIVIRAEHRPEPLAGRHMDDLEESPYVRIVRAPVILDRYPPAVLQDERGNIDRVGQRMTRQPLGGGTDRVAAGIGAERLDLDQT